jgi:hypothetical protein
MIDPLWDGNEFEVLCDMTKDWGGWTLYTAKNIYDYPKNWFLTVDTNKLEIHFNSIRYDYISPLWIKLPLIYKLFSEAEGKTILSKWQWISTLLWGDLWIHYKTALNFSNAIRFWEGNTSGISESNFKQAIIDDGITYMSSWKNTTVNEDYINMGTAFPFSHTNISNYLRFPASPYHGTYKIWSETFPSYPTVSNWLDNRSISIWVQ